MEGRGKENKSTQHVSALAENTLWTWLFHPVLQILHANFSCLPSFGQNSFLYTVRSDYSLTLVEKKVMSSTQSWTTARAAAWHWAALLGEVFLHSWGRFSCSAEAWLDLLFPRAEPTTDDTQRQAKPFFQFVLDFFHILFMVCYLPSLAFRDYDCAWLLLQGSGNGEVSSPLLKLHSHAGPMLNLSSVNTEYILLWL